MIYLPLNTPSKATFTLYENSSNITNPYYTFQFINKETLNEYVVTALDFSSVPYYYNSFTFSASLTYSSATAGVFQATTGQYVYNVFEMSSPYDLDLNNAINLVDTGICYVLGTYSNTIAYTQSSSTPISVYKNQDRL